MASKLDVFDSPDETADRPETARVVKIARSGSERGVHVAVIDADTRAPIGPCRGPALDDVSVDDVVLLVWTDEGPWIAAVDKSRA